MSLAAPSARAEVVLVLDSRGRLQTHVIRWTDRLRTKLWGLHLDRKLAEGTSPDSSVLLALRARMLMSPRVRRSLADAYERLAQPWSDDLPPGHLPIPSQPLTRARAELVAIAARLARGPVSVAGVAQAQLLLGDGGGPLYLPRTHDALQRAAQALLEALDPWPRPAE
jgi:hypothetical protein